MSKTAKSIAAGFVDRAAKSGHVLETIRKV